VVRKRGDLDFQATSTILVDGGYQRFGMGVGAEHDPPAPVAQHESDA
jgi:hypothetical protein